VCSRILRQDNFNHDEKEGGWVIEKYQKRLNQSAGRAGVGDAGAPPV